MTCNVIGATAQEVALARLLHESGREAVDRRLVYRNDVPVKPFAEWDDLHADAKAGRVLMARYLIARDGELREVLDGNFCDSSGEA